MSNNNNNVNPLPVKSNSHLPIPSTTLNNFKNKNLLNRIRRKEVIKELMETERLYVSDLQISIESCVNRLEAVSWLPLNKITYYKKCSRIICFSTSEGFIRRKKKFKLSEVARENDHIKWLIEHVQRNDKFIDILDTQDQSNTRFQLIS
ncbi:hypothetical protein BCR32DRAFT_286746 [Anaeromyces robustus]|uniref:DH domain-containing protein n=1 Tax=Anaeromyces robustus TaxID=1754192 RepID=A0A1Y1VUL6_9FUNG|nr:hypothetical protein BCR32DRAFT_286746 [Anaeromyces robustus]|eukprot:ORX64967.1 hypothetical protein BCR32DRAFT_286746 [Anaeromyces robustus]